MSGFDSRDHALMARALELARRGLYTTHPNPRVGCVLARDGTVVGEGWHRYAGGPHAEIEALRAAAEKARGACAYVTLEPCSHHGRTPPCTDALVQAGVSRVVAAMTDPNPQVAGSGLARLAAAGVEVGEGLMREAAQALNPGFLRRMRGGRPWVRIKLGASLDGRTALSNGTSQWITGPEARADVQLLRARADCILTGVGTVLADDPSMNLRIAPPWSDPKQARQPLRVVLDSRLRTPAGARLLGLPGRTLLVTADRAAAERWAGTAEILCVAADARGRPDLEQTLTELGRREINEVHVEAGAGLGGALLGAGLVDEIVLYLAPCLLGSDARGLFDLPLLERMEQRVDLAIREVRQIGADWRISARVSGA